jgi:2-polyprenyl-3-methyl-5-hydroxy-6-metoxy-1,4-benzoquinol methylase
MTKQAEREYALKVDQAHLYRKPFDNPTVFREFAVVLELFHRSLPPGGSILDLGCGPGWTSIFLARAGFDVMGIDISERMIAIAQERAAEENVSVTFHVADMEDLNLEQRDFDGVLLFDALHHCPHFGRVLQGAAGHLRDGGHLLLMEPSWLHRYSPHARATTRRYGVTELGFSRRQLNRELRQAGFQRLTQWHDGGPPFRGAGGWLWANLRLWCSYLWCFPQAKQIILAQK